MSRPSTVASIVSHSNSGGIGSPTVAGKEGRGANDEDPA